MEDSNIDYLSSEVKEILRKTPSKVSKWAMGGILFVVAAMVFVGFYFKYTEIIPGEFLLSTDEPPVSVQAPKTGRISKVAVKQNQEVEIGDTLAFFRSDAELLDVLKLEREIDSLTIFNVGALRAYEPDRGLQLGELASEYESFLSVFEFLPLSGSSQIDQNAIAALRQHNAQLRINISTAEVANIAIEDEVVALEANFRNKRDVYSDTRQDTLSRELYELNKQINEKKAEVSSNKLLIERYRELIRSNNARALEIELQSASGTETKIYQLRQSLSLLKNAIRRWKSQHIVTAPVSGKVSLLAKTKIQQDLQKGETMMVITPETAEEKYVGQVIISRKGSGKVKKGQSVLLKFYQYPFRQFGTVEAEVEEVFPLPIGENYAVNIILKNGMTSSTGQLIEFQQQMGGKAEIVTDKELFIFRLFEKLFPSNS